MRNRIKMVDFENVNIVFPNFSGIANDMNREGDRHFNMAIYDPEVARSMYEDGWNVKIYLDKEADPDRSISAALKRFVTFEDKFDYLIKNKQEHLAMYHVKIHVNYDYYTPPVVYKTSASTGRKVKLNEKTIGSIDTYAKGGLIDQFDMVVKLSLRETPDGRMSSSAYLSQGEFTIQETKLQARYASYESPEDDIYDEETPF